jgi:hypothetical protein
MRSAVVCRGAVARSRFPVVNECFTGVSAPARRSQGIAQHTVLAGGVGRHPHCYCFASAVSCFIAASTRRISA